MNEEQKRRGATCSESGSASAALATHVRGVPDKHVQGASESDKGNKTGKFRCFGCHEFGHFKRNCPNGSKKKVHKAKNVTASNHDGADCDGAEGGIAFVVKHGQDESGEGWLIDSGASKHMTNRKDALVSFREFKIPQLVRVGDGRTVEAVGIGKVQLEMKFKVSDSKVITMHDVLFVPKLASNLFSVGAAVGNGNMMQFRDDRCYIRSQSGSLHGIGLRKKDGLYQLNCKTIVPDKASVAASEKPSDLDLWHQRLGHINLGQLKEMVRKDMTKGMKLSVSDHGSFCEGCVEGKMARKVFQPVGEIRSKRKLQLVLVMCVDLWEQSR